MSALFELARKDLTILRRNPPALFWTFAWPLVFALFFGVLMSGGGGEQSAMAVALVDQAGTPAATRFSQKLGQSSAVTLEPMELEAARNAVRRGEKVALLVIPEGFGEGFAQFSGEGPALRLGVDPARKAEAGMLQGLVTEASFAVLQDDMQSPDALSGWQANVDSAAASGDLPPDVAKPLSQLFADVGALQAVGAGDSAGGAGGFGPPPIEQEPIARLTEGRPRSAFDITFPSAILWGLISCATGFAVSLVMERSEGTLLRLNTSPLTRQQVLLGKGFACFLACLATATLILVLGVLVFRVHIGSPLGVAAAVVATSVCFTGLMMLFSASGKTPQAVSGVSWAVLLVSAMIGGGMIPLIAMPAWMQKVSAVSPVRWGIYSIEGAIWRDFSAAEMVLPLVILLAVGTVAFTLGTRLFQHGEA